MHGESPVRTDNGGVRAFRMCAIGRRQEKNDARHSTEQIERKRSGSGDRVNFSSRAESSRVESACRKQQVHTALCRLQAADLNVPVRVYLYATIKKPKTTGIVRADRGTYARRNRRDGGTTTEQEDAGD